MPELFRPLALALAVLTTLGLPSRLASAQALDPSTPTVSTRPDDAHRLAVLEHELAMYAGEGKRQRLSAGVTGVALGAALLPAGIVLTHRHDPLLHLTGVGLIAGGAAQLTAFPGLFARSDLERVQARHQKRKAAGKSAAELVSEAEADWRHQAEVETKAWHWVGSIQLGLGAAVLPIGLTMLLKHEVGSIPHQRQVNTGATLIGIGADYVLRAVRMLFTTNPTEASWRASEGARRGWTLQTAESLSVAPVRDGALLTTGAHF